MGNTIVAFHELPKEDVVQRRYTEWGYNHETLDAIYWRVKCPMCEDGMMFEYVEGDPTRVVCFKCGYTKPAPNLSTTRRYTYEDYRELMLARDGFEWLFKEQSLASKELRREEG